MACAVRIAGGACHMDPHMVPCNGGIVSMTDSPWLPSENDLARLDVNWRPETPADQDFLHQLYASTRAAEQSLCGWPQDMWDLFIQQQFQLQYQHYGRGYPNAARHIILWQGQSVGRLCLHQGRDDLRIVDISLLPQARGQGIGAAILTACQSLATERALPLTLTVLTDNPARRLYQRLGFAVTDLVAGRYHMRWDATPCNPLTAPHGGH